MAAMLAPGPTTLAIDNQGTVGCIQGITRGAQGVGKDRARRRHGAGVRGNFTSLYTDLHNDTQLYNIQQYFTQLNTILHKLYSTFFTQKSKLHNTLT